MGRWGRKMSSLQAGSQADSSYPGHNCDVMWTSHPVLIESHPACDRRIKAWSQPGNTEDHWARPCPRILCNTQQVCSTGPHIFQYVGSLQFISTAAFGVLESSAMPLEPNLDTLGPTLSIRMNETRNTPSYPATVTKPPRNIRILVWILWSLGVKRLIKRHLQANKNLDIPEWVTQEGNTPWHSAAVLKLDHSLVHQLYESESYTYIGIIKTIKQLRSVLQLTLYT